MKKLLKLTLVFVFILAASQIKAQVRFGPEVGLNLAKMTLKSSGISYTPSTLTTFHVGLDVEFNLAKDFYMQSGILYSIKGYKMSISGEEEQASPNYIEIPIHFMGKFDIGGPKLLVIAGPYLAYGIGGKTKYGGQSQNIQFGSGDNSGMKPFDYGLDMGLGIEMSGVQLSGKYSLGLANFAPVSEFTMKNSVIEISLAYLIGKK